MSKSTGRFDFIDAIRATAALLVMFQHSLYESKLLGVPAHGLIPDWLELGETGVVAFFLVSGFVIPLSLEKTKDLKLFWVHRALRIYPLYFFIYLLTLWALGHDGIASFRGLAVNILWSVSFLQEYVNQPNFVGGSWTLSLELVWYISVATFYAAGFLRKTTTIVILTILTCVVAELVCIFVIRLPMGRLSMLVCCALGLVCFRLHAGEISTNAFVKFASILIAMIIANLVAGMLINPSAKPSATFQMASFSWLLAFLIFAVPYFTRKSEVWSHIVFKHLGKTSYSIYLIHPVILIVLGRLHFEGFGVIMVTAISTIALATLTYRYIEAPPIAFGHSVKAKMITLNARKNLIYGWLRSET